MNIFFLCTGMLAPPVCACVCVCVSGGCGQGGGSPAGKVDSGGFGSSKILTFNGFAQKTHFTSQGLLLSH